MGISGNNTADAATRDAVLQGNFASGVANLDFRTAPCQSVLTKWQRDWDRMQNSKLQVMKPAVHSWRSYRHPIHYDEVVVT